MITRTRIRLLVSAFAVCALLPASVATAGKPSAGDTVRMCHYNRGSSDFNAQEISVPSAKVDKHLAQGDFVKTFDCKARLLKPNTPDGLTAVSVYSDDAVVPVQRSSKSKPNVSDYFFWERVGDDFVFRSAANGNYLRETSPDPTCSNTDTQELVADGPDPASATKFVIFAVGGGDTHLHSFEGLFVKDCPVSSTVVGLKLGTWPTPVSRPSIQLVRAPLIDFIGNDENFFWVSEARR